MATKKKMLQAAAGVSTGPEGAWDLSYAYYDYENDPFSGDLTSVRDVSIKAVGTEENNPRDLFFKPDGTKVYIVGIGADTVFEYNLSTPWYINTASYSQGFSISAQEGLSSGLFFRDDGLKMYTCGYQGDDINEYDLSTAWDISTTSYVRVKSVSAQDTSPHGLWFKPDGTKAYLVGLIGQDINEYNLSTPWNISTLTYFQRFSTFTNAPAPKGVALSTDGTRMYVNDDQNNNLVEYVLSTPWNISTASFTDSYANGRQTNNAGMYISADGIHMGTVGFTNDYAMTYSLGGFDVSNRESSPTGIFFKPEGDKMYIVGQTGDDVNEYDLAKIPPFSVAAQEITPNDVFFKPDGTKMYVLGQTGQDVNEYDLSTAWGASTAVYLQNFSVASQEIYPEGIFFKPDGTKMYVTGQNGDDVNEYNLSTAWDISTSVYSQSFSVASQQTLPTGIFFKPDGTKMYVIGSQGNDDVTEYDLSTAWDISTASFNQNFSVAAQETNPEDVFFKPDGTKMYVMGIIGDDVNEYDLSAAWDISTSVFLQNFSVSSQDTAPTGLFFKPDGTRMFVIGQQNDSVNEYDLSTAWDVSTAAPAVDPEKYFDTSTAVFLQNFSVAAQDTMPQGVFFKPDGTKMYVIGRTGTDVNEYNLSTAWNISTASYSQNFSLASQETRPTGIFFKPDGTKMYVSGIISDNVNEYDLSIAWDISTSVYSQAFSVSPQDLIPSGLYFRDNGKQMYIMGPQDDDVIEYALSTAWDVSSAAYSQNFSVRNEQGSPKDLAFNEEGTKMYVLGSQGTNIFTYSLGVQE